MFIKLKNTSGNYIAVNTKDISNAMIIIEDLKNGNISYHVEILTKSNVTFKSDTVSGELDDYMEYLSREDINEILTATLCYVLNDTNDSELTRLKISSLAFAIYSITHTTGQQLAYDMGI